MTLTKPMKRNLPSVEKLEEDWHLIASATNVSRSDNTPLSKLFRDFLKRATEQAFKAGYNTALQSMSKSITIRKLE